MKVRLLFALLLCSLLSFAQDDYCSCMETDNSFQYQNSYDDLFTSLTQYKEELISWRSQTTIITRTKVTVPPKEAVTQTLVEEAYIEEQSLENADDDLDSNQTIDKTEVLEKTYNEVPEVPFEQVVIQTERTEREKVISGKGRLVSAKVKKKRKRLRRKLKRRKRVKKYRGGCPNF